MQSNVIFGFIFAAYLFYITARGELSTYLTILRGGGAEQNNSAASGSQNSSLAQQTTNAQNAGLIDPGQQINSDGTVSNTGNNIEELDGDGSFLGGL